MGLGRKGERKKSCGFGFPPKAELDTRACTLAVDLGKYPRNRREGQGRAAQESREGHSQGACITKLVPMEGTWGVVLLFASEELCRAEQAEELSTQRKDQTFLHQFSRCWPRVILWPFSLPGLSTPVPESQEGSFRAGDIGT